MNETVVTWNLVTKMTKNHQGVKVSNFVITISHCNFHKGYIMIYIYITLIYYDQIVEMTHILIVWNKYLTL